MAKNSPEKQRYGIWWAKDAKFETLEQLVAWCQGSLGQRGPVAADVSKMLATLSEKDRDVLIRFAWRTDEIAAAYGVARGTATRWLAGAKARATREAQRVGLLPKGG